MRNGRKRRGETGTGGNRRKQELREYGRGCWVIMIKTIGGRKVNTKNVYEKRKGIKPA